jgi:Zn-dependent peptidase ImmA (M78 family)
MERRANAFAAMLLMPPGRLAAVAATIEGDASPRERVMAISDRLQTSFSAAVEHMHNLGLLADEDRDVLRGEAVDQSGRWER